MLTNSPFFASFAVDDAEEFYTKKLGLMIADIGPGLLGLRAANGYTVLIYTKPNHEPATHTVVNFPVDDIEATVDDLRASGVEFEQYAESPIATNEKGIAHPVRRRSTFRCRYSPRVAIRTSRRPSHSARRNPTSRTCAPGCSPAAIWSSERG